MSRQLSWSILIIWILTASLLSGKCAELKNGEERVNGWQPLMPYDSGKVPAASYPYSAPHFHTDREPLYKPSQHRKSADTLSQYDYTPPSILGSFSIFGHSLPKNRDDQTKSPPEAINTNEYDFLVPPPRQKIEPYQKLKVSGDAYGGASHYRDIYTPLNTQFTFIPTGAASSVVKKHPIVPTRDDLRQYPTANEGHKQHKPLTWMPNVRDNIDPYHINNFRQYAVHETIIDGGRYYTQIGHPPVYKPYEVKTPPKPVVEKTNDYITPPNPYGVPTSSQQSEFPSFVKSNNRYAEPSDNYYNARKKNTTNWSIPSKNQFAELLPKLNKPVVFNRPSNVVGHNAFSENIYKEQAQSDKILPSISKTRQETPESISLKHFNEQQFLLQQQLLERDRQKLEQAQAQQTSTRQPEKTKERETTPVESGYDHDLGVYEAVKLTNEKISERPTRPTEIYSTKQVYEVPAKEAFTIDYTSEATRRPPEITYPSKKKKNHQRIIVDSGIISYDREAVYGKNRTEIHPEVIPTVSESAVTKSDFISEAKSTFTTATGSIPRTSPVVSTQTEVFTTSPSGASTTIELDTTTRKSTTLKTRSQNRGPTRRRRPILEAEPPTTPIETTFSTKTTEDNYPRVRVTPPYQSTEGSTLSGYQRPKPETEPTTEEEKGNTVISEELISLVTLGPSSARPITQHDHPESTPSTTQTTITIPEETTRISHRVRTTTRDYSYSIAPLEHLFNFTESDAGDESSTQASEWVPSVNKKTTNDGLNSPEPVEVTTRSYRLRPMKLANNTRPRFSVKDYKSRLDYRNRMSQTSTTESSPPSTASTKTKGTGKYKYTPRYSYTKTKSSTQGYVPKAANVTEPVEGKRSKLPAHRPFSGIHRNRAANTTDAGEGKTTEMRAPNPAKEHKFIQPIRRRPQLKTSAQFHQLIKKSKNPDSPARTTVEPITEVSEIQSETSLDEVSSPGPKNDVMEIRSKGGLEDIEMNEEKEQLKGTDDAAGGTTEVVKDSFANPNIQSDEEAFARASLSVADLTSSASALYNKPGMFKALSALPAFESDIHTKTLIPSLDEPSLPIEAFFRELSIKEK